MAQNTLQTPVKSVLSTLARQSLDRRETYNPTVANVSSELENQDDIEQKVTSHLDQENEKEKGEQLEACKDTHTLPSLDKPPVGYRGSKYWKFRNPRRKVFDFIAFLTIRR